MPFRTEHSCRLREPGEFQADSFRRVRNTDDQGRTIITIVGRLKGETETTAQALRYPISDWSESEARAACRRNNGILFEPAEPEGGDQAHANPRRRMRHLPQRVFGQPLAIMPGKLHAILGVLGERLELSGIESGLLDDELAEEHLPGSARSDIAVIPIVGTLVHRAFSVAPPSGLRSYASISRDLDAAMQDSRIRSIVLDIDSPGGEVNGMFELAEQIVAARRQKTITAIVDEQATSAAYLLASAAGEIFMSSTGLVGSIGVMAVHVDESGKDRQEGRQFTTIKSGERKDDFSPHAALGDDARARIEAEVDRVAGLFFAAVARNRGLEAETIESWEAGLFHGEQAWDAGLVDTLLPPRAALARLERRSTGRLQAAQHGNDVMAKDLSPGLRAAVAAATTEARPREVIVAELAEAAGITTGAMEQVLKGELSGPDDVVERWAGILGTTAGDLESAAPEPEPKPDNVTPFHAARERRTGIEYASEVHELCALAGRADLAGDFVRREVPVAQVRAKLIEARAAADNQEVSTHQHGAGGEDAGEMWKKIVANTNARARA